MLQWLFARVQEVIAEIRKIIWPSQSELVGTVIVVCAFALIFAVILGGMDTVFSALIKRILG